jgi:hypothetical protein
MRLAILTIGGLFAFSTPASADCLEDVEAFDLAAIQSGAAIADDPTTTPTARGRATFSHHVQEYLLEAETAAKAGNEPQCSAIFADALEIFKNE